MACVNFHPVRRSNQLPKGGWHRNMEPINPAGPAGELSGECSFKGEAGARQCEGVIRASSMENIETVMCNTKTEYTAAI
jgi:hypothetical protein